MRDLDDLTDVPDSEGEREILVVFHNLKGFDGMFILHELYQQQRVVEDQLTVGAKVLSLFLSLPLHQSGAHANTSRVSANNSKSGEVGKTRPIVLIGDSMIKHIDPKKLRKDMYINSHIPGKPLLK